MTGGRVPGRGPSRHWREEAGFSLVESVVSLVILGILLGLAFSGQSLIANRRLAGAARAVGTEIRWVEQRARAERRCWRVQFDPAGEDYQIQFLAGGLWTAAAGCINGTWTDYTSGGGRRLPRGIDLASTTFGGDLLTFTPYGNPNTGTVLLQSAGGEQRRVSINAAGRVTITR